MGKKEKSKRADLIKVCRYYKGEDECPFTSDGRYGIWKCENCWVSAQLEGVPFDDFLEEYSYVWLDDFFKDDGIPITLKAFLYVRRNGGEGMCTTEEFKQWYKNWYMRDKWTEPARRE